MKKLLGLREGESRIVLYLMSYLTLLCFGTSLGIAIATSMLLAEVGADKLPFIFVGISFAALCLSSLYPVLLARKGGRYICRLYAISGFLCILICNFMIRLEWVVGGINIGVFLQYLAFFVLLGWDIMHFGNYCQTVLNPLQRKRLYGLILSATKLGGILGGLCLGTLIQWMGQVNVLLIWAAAYLLSGIVLILFETKLEPENQSVKRNRSQNSVSILQSLKTGFGAILNNSFLTFFALIIALDICTGSLMVFQFNEGLGQIYAGRGEELSTFLGQFAAVSNGLALVLQIFLAPRLTAILGVGWVNFFYPIFSVTVLGLSMVRWDLAVVTILMFHKDYLSSIIHMPNRALFYNAIAPENRSFMLGFLEGTWTHCINLIFGLILIGVVQLGPTFSSWFESGFSFAFSILGLAFFALYFFAAWQLKKYYGLQLLDVVKNDDLLAKVKKFTLREEELSELQNNEEGEVEDYLEFIPSDLNGELQTIYQKAHADLKWQLSMLHRSELKSLHQNMNEADRWELFSSIYPIKLRDKLRSDSSTEELTHLLQDNLKKSKVIRTLMHYCLIFNRVEFFNHISYQIKKLPKKSLPDLADLAHFFEASFDESVCKHLLSEGYQTDVDNQTRILRGISYSAHTSVIPRLVMFFGIASRVIRKLVVKVAYKLAENEPQIREKLKETYFKRDWPYHARLTWFSLFEEFPDQERENLLDQVFKVERMRLLSLTQLKSDLEKQSIDVDEFLEAVNEEISYQCNFLLIYFRSEFEKVSLEIIRKALFEKHSSRRYEAIELLSSTGKSNICNLILPFLEFQKGDQLLDALQSVEDLDSIKQGINHGLEYCITGPDEWLRAVALNWLGEHKLQEYMSILESLPQSQDMLSGEMISYCKSQLV